MSFFKYYAPDSFDFICVEGGVSVRFSQPSVLNDIFELNGSINEESSQRSIYKTILKENPLLNDISFENLQPLIDRFKPDFFNYMSVFSNTINDTQFGVLSLSRRKDSRSMWSYYANEHQGFMVEFNEKSETSEYLNFDHEHGDVNYEIIRPKNIISINNKSEERNKLINELFFTKDKDWEHEEEYRVLASIPKIQAKKLDNNGFPIHSVTIPVAEIDAIYLGVRSSETLARKAKFWIKQNSPAVKLYKAEPCRTEYKLNYNEVKI
jgi:hypothetical protein